MKALVLSLVALAGIALAGAEKPVRFTSRRAEDARKTFEKAVERLEAEHQTKLRKARGDYVKSLEAALKEARKAKNESEAALIERTIADLERQGAAPKASKGNRTAPEKIGRYVFTGGKGDTLEAAVVIEVATDSTEAVEAEGLWLEKHYPPFTKRRQALLHEAEKTYDEIEIHGPGGKVKKIYFDITGCFGFPELRRGG
jgi:hypothetical protein